MAKLSLKVGLIFYLKSLKLLTEIKKRIEFIAFECHSTLVHKEIHYIALELKEAPKLFQQSSLRGRLCLKSQVRANSRWRRCELAWWAPTYQLFDVQQTHLMEVVLTYLALFSWLLNSALGPGCLSSTDFFDYTGVLSGVLDYPDSGSAFPDHGTWI